MLLACLLLSIMFLARADDTLSVTVDPNQAQFQIELPANPTTGYQWTVEKYDTSLLILRSSQYIAPQTQIIGAGGKMLFNFSLVTTKNYPSGTTIVFKYARPGEPDKGTLKTVIVNF